MTPEEITSAVKVALEAHQEKYWVPGEQHYQDHLMLSECRTAKQEWLKNHEFISNVRCGIDVGKKTSIRIIVAALLTFIAGALYQFFKETLR